MSYSASNSTPNRPRPVRRFIITLVVLAVIYVGSYAFNSYSGGYWVKPEHDGRDQHLGVSLQTAILWQPRHGYWAPHHSDWIGKFYAPLIRLDRQYLHPTRYVSDLSFLKWVITTTAKDWHPSCRVEFEESLKIGDFWKGAK